jgi:hypothetical protein
LEPEEHRRSETPRKIRLTLRPHSLRADLWPYASLPDSIQSFTIRQYPYGMDLCRIGQSLVSRDP